MAALAALAALPLILGACGGSGLTLAREACVHVNASIRLFDEARHAPDAGLVTLDKVRAIKQLEAALPLAAQATSADPQWNPLQTTLQEIGRNTESNLIPALRSQCALADTNGEQAPTIAPATPGAPTPSTLPGQ